MKTLFVLLFITLLNCAAFAQDPQLHSIRWGFIKHDLEYAFNSQLNYPSKALEDSIHGRVVVQFIINHMSGDLEDVKIIIGLREDIDQEAIRIAKLTKWEPIQLMNPRNGAVINLPLFFSPEGGGRAIVGGESIPKKSLRKKRRISN